MTLTRHTNILIQKDGARKPNGTWGVLRVMAFMNYVPVKTYQEACLCQSALVAEATILKNVVWLAMQQ